jgi:hypothetical protein
LITATPLRTPPRIGAVLCSLALAILACNSAGGIISGASTPTPVSPATPAMTATATITPVPLLPQLAVQLPDQSVWLYQPDGQSRLLTQANLSFTSPLYRYFAHQAAVNETLYLVADTADFTARVYSLSASGVTPLDFIEKIGEGFDVTVNTPVRVAWDTYTTETTLTSQIFVSALDGTQPQAVLTESNSDRILVVAGWSRDGQQLYFSREPLGLGGYILFGGLSNLSVYTVADGSSQELISSEAAGTICLDALSPAPREHWVADHCATHTVAVRNLQTGERNELSPPAGLTEANFTGSARFSPDGTRVAYALARGEPENEQGWAAVSEGLSGGSHLIATGAPGGYFTVVGWLDANTVVLQFWGMTSPDVVASVWLARADGTDVKHLADGSFLGFWE